MILTARAHALFADAAARGFAGLLRKPFDLDALTSLVQRLVAPEP